MKIWTIASYQFRFLSRKTIEANAVTASLMNLMIYSDYGCCDWLSNGVKVVVDDYLLVKV